MPLQRFASRPRLPRRATYLLHGINSRAGPWAGASMLVLKRPQRARPRTAVSCRCPVGAPSSFRHTASEAWCRVARALSRCRCSSSHSELARWWCSVQKGRRRTSIIHWKMHEPSRLGAKIRSRRKGRLQPPPHLTSPAGQLCLPNHCAVPWPPRLLHRAARPGLPNPLHRLAVPRPLGFRRAKRLPSRLTMQPKWCPFVLRTTTRDNPHRRPIQPRPHQRGSCSTQARRRLPLRQLRPKLSRRLGHQMPSSGLVPAIYRVELHPRHVRQLWPV